MNSNDQLKTILDGGLFHFINTTNSNYLKEYIKFFKFIGLKNKILFHYVEDKPTFKHSTTIREYLTGTHITQKSSPQIFSQFLKSRNSSSLNKLFFRGYNMTDNINIMNKEEIKIISIVKGLLNHPERILLIDFNHINIDEITLKKLQKVIYDDIILNKRIILVGNKFPASWLSITYGVISKSNESYLLTTSTPHHDQFFYPDLQKTNA